MALHSAVQGLILSLPKKSSLGILFVLVKALFGLVWGRRPEQVWKGCSQIRDCFAMRQLKESE